MLIFHVADTHIGYSAYGKTDSVTGWNQREVDVYDSVRQFVDCALEVRPDVILHSGDLFDSVRPSTRALTFAMSQLLRLSEEGIPTVIISGNHETPRTTEALCVFELFVHLPNIYPIYHGRYQTAEVGDLKIHAFPQDSIIDEELRNVLQYQLNNTTDYNVALIHGSVTGESLPSYMTGDPRESIFDLKDLSAFDYVALGHWHVFTEVEPTIYYSGSTERFGFSEVGQEKGFVEVRLNPGECEVHYHPLKVRDMIDLPVLGCKGLGGEEVNEAIRDAIERSSLKEAIVRLRLRDLSPPAQQTIDYNVIRSLTKDTVHFDLKIEAEEESPLPQGEGAKFETLREEFEEFVEGYKLIKDKDKAKLLDLAYKYLDTEEE